MHFCAKIIKLCVKKLLVWTQKKLITAIVARNIPCDYKATMWPYDEIEHFNF